MSGRVLPRRRRTAAPPWSPCAAAAAPPRRARGGSAAARRVSSSDSLRSPDEAERRRARRLLVLGGVAAAARAVSASRAAMASRESSVAATVSNALASARSLSCSAFVFELRFCQWGGGLGLGSGFLREETAVHSSSSAMAAGEAVWVLYVYFVGNEATYWRFWGAFCVYAYVASVLHPR